MGVRVLTRILNLLGSGPSHSILCPTKAQSQITNVKSKIGPVGSWLLQRARADGRPRAETHLESVWRRTFAQYSPSDQGPISNLKSQIQNRTSWVMVASEGLCGWVVAGCNRQSAISNLQSSSHPPMARRRKPRTRFGRRPCTGLGRCRCRARRLCSCRRLGRRTCRGRSLWRCRSPGRNPCRRPDRSRSTLPGRRTCRRPGRTRCTGHCRPRCTGHCRR